MAELRIRRRIRVLTPRVFAFFALTLACCWLAAAPPASAQPPADLGLALVVGGLDRPITIRHAGDGSGRLFIVEQSGTIRIFDGTQLLATPFLDITGPVNDSGNEQGLLGLAFHPDYANNGFFYVNYTAGGGSGRTVVSRFTVSADPNVANAASELVILEANQDFSNHNGGNILFGPDGYLYIGFGDGGSGGDPNNRSQTLGNLLGKMLRIDVDTPTPGTGTADYCATNPNDAYSVPANNPFTGTTGSCDEIWAYGLRNPWRWSFDRINGDLFMGDVGQNQMEEIDYQPVGSGGGENYGWSCMEGTLTPDFNDCDGSPLTAPIFTYLQAGNGCSITGGYSYRGGGVVGLDRTYIYGDFCTGKIWFGNRDEMGNWSDFEWDDTSFSISSFGEDEEGEVYLADFGTNSIYRFESASSVFADGFESGDFRLWSSAVGAP